MPAPTTQNPAALGSSEHFVTYAGAVADTNLMTEGGGAACRRIRCKVAGALNVKRASDHAEVILNFTAGETQDVSASALVASGSTATDVTIYY